jgi:DNA repair protein RadC
MRRGRALSSPGLVREYLSIAYGARESELFGMVMLDTRHQLLGVAELFNGTIGRTVDAIPLADVKLHGIVTPMAVLKTNGFHAALCDPEHVRRHRPMGIWTRPTPVRRPPRFCGTWLG